MSELKDDSDAEMQKMSELKAGSDVIGPGMDETKRPTKLTVKALAGKIQRLQKERQASVNKIKGVIQSIKDLMQTDENVSVVRSQLGNIIKLSEDIILQHKAVIALLPEEEKEKQQEWFTSISKHTTGFVQDVKRWLSELGRPFPDDMNVNAALHRISEDDQQVQDKTCISAAKVTDTVPYETQDDIKPSDSVSNVGSGNSGRQSSAGGRSHRKSSSSGRRSSHSTASSACIKAEADMAALITRQHLLKDKHDLEEQEEQLRKRKEQLKLQVEIAATRAKVNVLRGSPNQSVISDGMESYFERGKYERKALNAEAGLFLPQSIQQDRQSQPAGDNANPHLVGVRSKDGSGQLKPKPTLLSHTELQGHQDTSQRPNAEIHTSNVASLNAAVVSGSSEQNPVFSIMEKQNEITALLAQQQCLSSLPKREIEIFDGDPLQYQAFIRAFEHSIESKTNNARDCLYFLEQYTRGQPRELVRSCQHMASDRGHAKAKALLREHFGNEQKMATAYMEKVLAWASIKSDDSKALQAYSLFLRGCCNAMEEIQDISELDMPANMLFVIKKLPYKLRDRWRTVACELQGRHNRRATFVDIVNFIEKQVRIESDPVFGDIKDTPVVTANKDVTRFKSQPRYKVKGSSFATIISAVEKKAGTGTIKTESGTCIKKKCLFCDGGHALELCSLLEKKAHSEKIGFLKDSGVCFGCLGIGHISKDCRKHLTCKVCSLKHPDILHIYQRGKERYAEREKQQVEAAKSSATVSVQTGGLTGAGDHNCKLSIVPVQVKSKKGHKTVHTYAFLDHGSTASFCTVGLMNKLNLSGRRSNILLRTMGQKKIVESYIVPDLEVAGLDSECYCELPNTYTQKNMPVHRGNIPRQEDIHRWPHLRHVFLPVIDSEIELLIGSNVPKALEPLEVIQSVDDGPYAVKTILGWTVNGPLGGDRSCEMVCEQPQVCVNRISVVRLDELWKQQFKIDFPESDQEEQQGLSREDCQFMDLVTKSAKKVGGHFEIGLPFRNKEIKMPNNRRMAEQRALNLRRRFNKDASFHTDYSVFMDDIISKGYAQRVPAEELERSDGRVWYLPHHGVSHPKKKKIRVVFDCAATFQGTSLNDQLLQGPDLTSPLIGVMTRFRKVAIIADIEADYDTSYGAYGCHSSKLYGRNVEEGAANATSRLNFWNG